MLDFIEIKNFRSCEDFRMRLGEPVVALVGKNGAGKTNVLHAIQLAADLCVGEPSSSFGLNSRHQSEPTSFKLEFSIGNRRFIYSTSRSGTAKPAILEETLEKDGHTLIQRRGEVVTVRHGPPSEVRIGATAATLPTLLSIFPHLHPILPELMPVSNYLRSIRYYPLLQGFQEHLSGPPLQRIQLADTGADFSPLIERSKYEAWEAELSQGRARRSVQMRLLHLYLARKDAFQELKTLLGEQGLGLLADIRVEVVRIQAARSNESEGYAFETGYVISFQPGASLAGSGQTFRFTGLSAGTWRILQLLTYLVFDESSCMLVEQPEDSIHPGLLSKVIDILRTYAGRTQLICTTHSPNVMNEIGAKGIRLITSERGCTTAIDLDDTQLTAVKMYLEEQGTLAEFLEAL